MKATAFLTGLMSTAVLTSMVTSMASSFSHKHHHGLGHHIRPTTSAGSGSGIWYGGTEGLEVVPVAPTGAGNLDIDSVFTHEDTGNCTLSSSMNSGILEESAIATSEIASVSSRTSPEYHTTIHLTKTTTVVVTRHPTDVSRVRGSQKEATRTISASAVVDAASATNPSSDLFGGNYQAFQLGSLSASSTASESQISLATVSAAVCPARERTTFTSTQGQQYQVVCDVDYPNHDLQYLLTKSFDECVQFCDTYNTQSTGGSLCVGALYVPSRVTDVNDCYLKSSVDNPSAATFSIVGAVLVTASPSSSSPSSAYSLTESANAASVTTSVPSKPSVATNYGSSVLAPSVVASQLHGPTFNKPTTQYISWKGPSDLKLDSSLLNVGVDLDLSTKFPPSSDTGILELNSSTENLLADLNGVPHLSRDGGKGGALGGQHLFVFCDTGSYTAPTDSANGDFLGFVSSSVAVDTGMNGLSGNPLNLQDGIGEWSDNAGRMRGFSPLTQGEQSYNLAMQGNGQRYAVWPESSLIPLDATNAVMYAPIIYDNVNMATKAAIFTYAGATLLTITAGGRGGPVATRTVDRLFGENDIEWGCIGGIRSWGPSGVGGSDGKVYLFGRVPGGLLLARVSYSDISDLKSYEYWTSSGWEATMPSSSSTAYFISGDFMDVDVFYSPRHLTFIIVYMTTYADNTFYFRYLKANEAILPPSAPGADPSSDYVEALVAHPWSEERVVYKASPGLSGKYIYCGGVHQGYYGDDDIANGGTKMLLSWTAPTGNNPASGTSEYQIITAEVDWA